MQRWRQLRRRGCRGTSSKFGAAERVLLTSHDDVIIKFAIPLYNKDDTNINTKVDKKLSNDEHISSIRLSFEYLERPKIYLR